MKTMVGFRVLLRKDLIDEGTNGKITQVKLSTVAGLNLTQTVELNWENANGGSREWTSLNWIQQMGTI